MTDMVTRPAVDRLLDYPSRLDPLSGRCRLRAFPDVRVAVVTELENNPGPPIANCIEAVALAAEQALDARFFGTSWRLIEHHPARQKDDPLAYALVTFGGYEKRSGHLSTPGRQPIPAAMDWLREVIR